MRHGRLRGQSWRDPRRRNWLGRAAPEEEGPHGATPRCHRPAPRGELRVSRGLRGPLGEGVRGLGAERARPTLPPWMSAGSCWVDFFALGCEISGFLRLCLRRARVELAWEWGTRRGVSCKGAGLGGRGAEDVGAANPDRLLKSSGSGSECTPVEEVKPERVLSEDRERGDLWGRKPES